MTFLNLWALWLAAIVVPALLLLYFLKLRRREQRISSTLLWKQAVQDLQVNAPFQRLRRNLLLFLQLLILALVILTLARPLVRTTLADEERVVLLIDHSASMNTREADGTRLDQAREQAVRLVKTLNRRARSWRSFLTLQGAEARTQIMVIAFAERAHIVAPFTTNSAELETLIRGITPSDGRTNLAEALDLAAAYLAPPTMLTPGMESTPVSTESPARLVLISDGCVPDMSSLSLRGGALEWLPIGAATDNVGITALRTQRNYEQPEILNVFLSVANFGPQPVTTDLSLYVDGTLTSVATVALEGAAPADATEANESPRAATALSFTPVLERGAVIEARLARSDALDVDDVARAVVAPPRRLRVLVVTAGNRLLDYVLSGLPLAEYPFISLAQYDANAEGRFYANGRSLYDVVVFDKVAPHELSAGNYLFLGALPPLPGVVAGEPVRDHDLVWWDSAHPVLRHVGLERAYVAESIGVKLPPSAETLIEGPAGPVLFRYADQGRHCLTLTFAAENSNWWSGSGFVVFMYNALRYLGSSGSDVEEGVTHPGDTLRVRLPATADDPKLAPPHGAPVKLVPDASGVAYFGGTSEVGVYSARWNGEDQERFAVNLEDPQESRVAPPAEPPHVGTQEVHKLEAIRTATPEVWRWFVGAVLVLVLLEWYIYNRRVMI